MTRLLAVLVAVGAAWPAAGSPAAVDVPCTFTAEFTIEPGLSLEPAAGTFTSGGETGRMTCIPPATAGRVLAEGPFGAEGRFGTDDPDRCTGGEGTGLQSFTAPAPTGPAHMTNAIRFVFAAASPDGVMSGHFEGERFSGTFTVVPLEGDCVTRPVTRLLLSGRGMLRA